MQIDAESRTAYLEAYERWQRDIGALHDALFGGKRPDPPHFIALLRRESHSKARYDAARRTHLGLPAADEDDEAMMSDFPPDAEPTP